MAVRLPPGHVAGKGAADLAGLLEGTGLSDRIFAHRGLWTNGKW